MAKLSRRSCDGASPRGGALRRIGTGAATATASSIIDCKWRGESINDKILRAYLCQSREGVRAAYTEENSRTHTLLEHIPLQRVHLIAACGESRSDSMVRPRISGDGMRPRLPDTCSEVIARDGVRDAVPVHDEPPVLYGLCMCVAIRFVQGCMYDEQQYTFIGRGRRVRGRGRRVGLR